MAVSQHTKDYLGITGSTDADMLDRFEDSAERIIETYVGYKIWETSGEWTEDYDGTGTRELYVKHVPITALSSVKIASDRLFDSVTSVQAVDMTYRGDEGAIVLLAQGFGTAPLSVRVVYTGGLSALPNDLKDARAMVTAVLYHRAKEGADGIKSERLGERSVEYTSGAIPREARDILNEYKRWRV
jgi:hypothetical protein